MVFFLEMCKTFRFLGGAPDLNNFTGSRYMNGFEGCIHVIESLNDGSIGLEKNAVSGVNVDTCSK